MHLGGLGFTYKWNMGWMHDVLEYVSKDAVYRRWDHNLLTFSGLYMFTENFILPLSHDEVVHGKGALLDKLAGDAWQKYATLRALYGFMFAHPGQEAAVHGRRIRTVARVEPRSQPRLASAGRPGARRREALRPGAAPRTIAPSRRFTRATSTRRASAGLTATTTRTASSRSCAPRATTGSSSCSIFNFTPVPRAGYRIGVPEPGFWVELINSDSAMFGGSNVGNGGGVQSEPVAAHGFDNSIDLTLPPLGCLLLKRR